MHSDTPPAAPPITVLFDTYFPFLLTPAAAAGSPTGCPAIAQVETTTTDLACPALPLRTALPAKRAEAGLATGLRFAFFQRTRMSSLVHSARALIIGMMIIIRQRPGHGDVA